MDLLLSAGRMFFPHTKKGSLESGKAEADTAFPKKKPERYWQFPGEKLVHPNTYLIEGTGSDRLTSGNKNCEPY